MRPTFRQIAFCLLLVFPITLLAQESTRALTFQAWKDQQVLGAQNQILRISARINQLKNAKPGALGDKDEGALPSSHLKKVDQGEQLALAESELKRAQESMETASGLQLDDYIAIYLPTLQDQPEAVAKLVDKLSKDELAEITKALIHRGAHPSDARHNTAEGLTASLRGRGL